MVKGIPPALSWVKNGTMNYKRMHTRTLLQIPFILNFSHCVLVVNVVPNNCGIEAIIFFTMISQMCGVSWSVLAYPVCRPLSQETGESDLPLGIRLGKLASLPNAFQRPGWQRKMGEGTGGFQREIWTQEKGRKSFDLYFTVFPMMYSKQ